MSIKSLPEEIRNTVRSAYSINNIIHCITELILNSLDANSNCVAVRVNLKTFRIHVIDNGDGISESDMTVVGVRYMTSKCHSKDDLEKKPKQHGFKGESLASIISISERVTITSKQKNTDSTIKKHFEKGNMKEITQEKVRSSSGTTVEIDGFMYNIRVRQARIRPSADMEAIKNIMECLAIINPDVSFSLRNDSTCKLVMSNNKSKTVLDSLCNIHSQLSTSNMQTRKVYRNKISITGLLTKELFKDKLQFLYVNKRPVISHKIQKLIADLYTKYNSESLLKKNAHPVYVINIRCPHSEVSYSFDSLKTTVEFKRWHIIEKCIQKLIKTFLGVKNEQSKTELVKVGPSPEATKNVDVAGVSQLEFAVKSKPAKRVFSSDKKNQSACKAPEKEETKGSSDEFEPSPKIILHENLLLNKNSKSNDSKTISKEEKEHSNGLFDKFFKKSDTKKNANRRKQKPKKQSKAVDNNFNSLFFKHLKRDKVLPIVDTAENFQTETKKSIFERHQNTHSLISNDEIHSDPKSVENLQLEVIHDQIKGKEFILDKFLADAEKLVDNIKYTDNVSAYSVVMTHKTFVQSIVQSKGFIMSIQNEDVVKSVEEKEKNPVKLSKCIQTTLHQGEFEVTAKLFSEYFKMKPPSPEKNNKKFAITDLSKSFNDNDITISTEMWKQIRQFREQILENCIDNIEPAEKIFNKNDNKLLYTTIRQQNSTQTFLSHLNYDSHCNYKRGRNFLEEKRNEQHKNKKKKETKEIPLRKSENVFIIPEDTSKAFVTKKKREKFTFDKITNPVNKNKLEGKNIFAQNVCPCKNEKPKRAPREKLNIVFDENLINEKQQDMFFDKNFLANECRERNHQDQAVHCQPYPQTDFSNDDNYVVNKLMRKEKDKRTFKNVHKEKSKQNVCCFVDEKEMHKGSNFLETNSHYFTNDENQNNFFANDIRKNDKHFDDAAFFDNRPKKRTLCLTDLDLSTIKADSNKCGKYYLSPKNRCKKYYLSPSKKTKQFEIEKETDNDKSMNKFEFSKYFLPLPKRQKKSTLVHEKNLVVENKNLKCANKVLPKRHNVTPETIFEQHNQCSKIYWNNPSDFASVRQNEYKNGHFFNTFKLPKTNIISPPLANDFISEKNLNVDKNCILNTKGNFLFDDTNLSCRNEFLLETQNLNSKMSFGQHGQHPVVNSKNIFGKHKKENLFQLKPCEQMFLNSRKLPDITFSTPLINDFTKEETIINLKHSSNMSNVIRFPEEHYRNPISKTTDDDSLLSLEKTYRNERPTSEKSCYFDCTIISNNFNFLKPSGTATMSVFKTQNTDTQTQNVNKETHITCPKLTNKESEEKISLFDTGNDKCDDVGGRIITNPNISCFTTKSDRSNGSDFWVKKTDNFGSIFYLNKKTGMTTFYTPKFENQFNVIKRLNFVPKGRSPMFVKNYKIDKILSLETKEKLKNAILECYSEELELCEKCIDTKNVKSFLSQIYKESANKFDNVIPSIQKNSYVSQNFTKDIFLQLEVLGQIDLKYIAAVIKDQKLLLLFDQHAVNERVRLEKLYEEYQEDNKSNKLVFRNETCKETILLSLPDSDMNLLKSHHKIFSNFGLTYSSNKNCIKILTVPTCLMNKSLKRNADETNTLENLTKALVTELIDCLKVTGFLINVPKVIQNIINSEACRGAIKFGDALDKEKCVQLLKQLAECKLPFQCAHGRPTLTPVIDFSKNNSITKVCIVDTTTITKKKH